MLHQDGVALADSPLAPDLAAYADLGNKSTSIVAEAAIACFLSPDYAERQEAALARRLSKGPTLLREVSLDLPGTTDRPGLDSDSGAETGAA